MRNYVKQNFFITLLLSTVIIFSAFPLRASSTNNSYHRQTIQRFVDDIKVLQNQVFTLAELSFENSPENQLNIKNQIKIVNLSIESLDKQILEYLSTLPSISYQNSNTLLVQNALNLVKNSLYQIDLLTTATSNLDRLLILQEFFRLRVNATETLTGLENIISS